MKTSNELVFITFCVISIVINLFIIQLLLRKLKPLSESENKTKISYGIWIFVLFIALSINTAKSLDLLNEAFDTISKTISQNPLWEMVQISSIFIGLNVIWFIIWLSVSQVLSMILIGKRHIVKEMESNNISYFLIRGVLLIGTILSFIVVFEQFLRFFIPTIEMTFIH